MLTFPDVPVWHDECAMVTISHTAICLHFPIQTARSGKTIVLQPGLYVVDLFEHEFSFLFIVYGLASLRFFKQGMQIYRDTFRVSKFPLKFVGQFRQVHGIVHVDVEPDADVDTGILKLVDVADHTAVGIHIFIYIGLTAVINLLGTVKRNLYLCQLSFFLSLFDCIVIE